MVVRCSQCGAQIHRTDEGRFFTCPFCSSSLVLEGGRSFACYVMVHTRRDVWVRAAFEERLAAAGFPVDTSSTDISLTYHPYWVIHTRDSAVLSRSAVHTDHMELSSVKVPPGRLIFLDTAGRLPGTVIPFTLPPEAVFGGEGERIAGIMRIDLVYLPIYTMRYRRGATIHTAFLVGDSRRVYSNSILVPKERTSPRSLLFFAGALALFVFVGIFFNDITHRLTAIGAAAVLSLIMSLFIIDPKEDQS